MKIYRINVDSTQSMEEVAEWLAGSASSVFDEMFPDQWQEAMVLLAQCLNRTVAQDRAMRGRGGAPIVVEDEGEVSDL